MGLSWDSNGIFMRFSCDFHVIFMGLHWILMGFSLDFHVIFMGFS